MRKPDPLKPGRDLLESMMKEAQEKPRDGKEAVSLDDKLKIIDRWMKFRALELNHKRGGMGSGFDQGEVDDED